MFLKAQHEDTTPASFIGKGQIKMDDGNVLFAGRVRGFTGTRVFKLIAFMVAIPAAIGISMVTGIFPLYPLLAFMVLAILIDAIDRKDESITLKGDSLQRIVEDLAKRRFLVVGNRFDSGRVCVAWMTDSETDAKTVSAQFRGMFPGLVAQGTVKGTTTR